MLDKFRLLHCSEDGVRANSVTHFDFGMKPPLPLPIQCGNLYSALNEISSLLLYKLQWPLNAVECIAQKPRTKLHSQR